MTPQPMPTNLTIVEAERWAYATGDTKTAALLDDLADAEERLADTLERLNNAYDPR